MSVIIKSGLNGEPLLAHKKKNSTVVLEFSNAPSEKQASHASIKPSKEEEEGKKKWIEWGANNDFPADIARILRRSTVGRSGLHRLTKYMYGQRLNGRSLRSSPFN